MSIDASSTKDGRDGVLVQYVEQDGRVVAKYIRLFSPLQ